MRWVYVHNSWRLRLTIQWAGGSPHKPEPANLRQGKLACRHVYTHARMHAPRMRAEGLQELRPREARKAWFSRMRSKLFYGKSNQQTKERVCVLQTILGER